MMPTQFGRYRGAMLGTHAGDSAGAKYEWMTAADIREDFEVCGGLVLADYLDPWGLRRKAIDPTVVVRHMRAGQPTDDAELAALLAASIVDHSDFHEAHAYLRLRDFIHGNTGEGRKSFLTHGEAYGSGGTLRKALKPLTYAESDAGFKAGRMDPLLATNGSLMRCISVPLFAYRDFDRMVDIARRQSLLTHRHPSAVAACVAYSTLVASVLYGQAPALAWETTKKALSRGGFRQDAALQDILAVPTSLPSEEEMRQAKGTTKDDNRYGDVILTFRVALAASIAATDFRDGITKAIEGGGDTDTYAAIAGGILGSHFGILGIPQEWRDALQGREIMIGLADSLFEFSHPDFAPDQYH